MEAKSTTCQGRDLGMLLSVLRGNAGTGLFRILDTQTSMYAAFVFNLLLLFAMVAVLKNYQSRGMRSLSIKKSLRQTKTTKGAPFLRKHVI